MDFFDQSIGVPPILLRISGSHRVCPGARREL